MDSSRAIDDPFKVAFGRVDGGTVHASFAGVRRGGGCGLECRRGVRCSWAVERVWDRSP